MIAENHELPEAISTAYGGSGALEEQPRMMYVFIGLSGSEGEKSKLSMCMLETEMFRRMSRP